MQCEEPKLPTSLLAKAFGVRSIAWLDDWIVAREHEASGCRGIKLSTLPLNYAHRRLRRSYSC
jgi:hypothetical protein